MSDKPTESPGLINQAAAPDTPGAAERRAVLKARREARAALPAVYVDTWATLVWPGHLRFVLGEWLHGGPHYRGAFLMELSEVERFANALLEIVKEEREKEDSEGEQSGAGAEE